MKAIRNVIVTAWLLWLAGCGGGGGAASFIFFEPGALPLFQTGLFYNIQFVARNAATPVTWSITGGTLPPGLNFNALGLLTGTPISSGDFNFIVKARDATGAIKTAFYSATVVLSANTLLVRVRDACDQPLANAVIYLTRTPAISERLTDSVGETAFLAVDPPYLVTVGYDDSNPATADVLKSYYLRTQNEVVVHFNANAAACVPTGSGSVAGAVSGFAPVGGATADVSVSSAGMPLAAGQGYSPITVSPAAPAFSFPAVQPPGSYAASAIAHNAGGAAVGFGIVRNLPVVSNGHISALSIPLAVYSHAVGGLLTFPPGVSAMTSAQEYAGYRLSPEGFVIANYRNLTDLALAPTSYQLGIPSDVVTAQDKGVVLLRMRDTLDSNGAGSESDDVQKEWCAAQGLTIGVFDGTADVTHPVILLPEPTVTTPSKGDFITRTPNVNWTMSDAHPAGVTSYRLRFSELSGAGGTLNLVPAWDLFIETNAPFQSGFTLPSLPNSLGAIGGLIPSRAYMLEVASQDLPVIVSALGFDDNRPDKDFRISSMRTGPLTVN